MKILFFDTETSGLPLWKEPSDDPRQPRIVSLAAMLHDAERQPLRRILTLIKPDGWTIGADTTAIHGITNEQALAEGRDVAGVMREFMSMYDEADLLVGHNVSFDIRMMRIEMKRMGLDKLDKASFCTAIKSTELCNLEPTEKMVFAGFMNPKKPKLTEAYKVFFNEEFEAHNAMNDMEACARVYYHLKDQGI